MLKPLVCVLVSVAAVTAQQPAANGAASYTTRCSVCHGGDGNGNDRAPAILGFVAASSDDQVAALIRKGVKAMPAHTIADPEMKDLVAFLRTLRPPRGDGRPDRDRPA